MTNISRRAALVATAGAIPAALAGSASSAEPASELDDIIAAHKLAWDRFIAAADAEAEMDSKQSRPEIFVPLSIGGGQSVQAHHSLWQAAFDLRRDIANRYRGETQRMISMLERVSPEAAQKAKAALRKAQADDLRAMRRIVDQEERKQEASGVAAIMREYHEASDAERDALDVLLSYRCKGDAELSTKATYIKRALDGCRLDEEHVDLLLASMMKEGEA